MKRLAEVITVAGFGIIILGACCMDSPGIYGYVAGIAGIFGGFAAGIGYAIKILVQSRKSNNLYFPKSKSVVGDAAWIEWKTEK